MRIAFKNFGCRTNSFESDTLYLEAIRRGIEVVSEDAIADAYVINSCTVTANADRDARNQVYRFRRKNPESKIAVIGCYAQVAKEELLALQEVDIVLGTADKLKVLDLIYSSERDHVAQPSGFLPGAFLGSRHARANIKIQDGCNYRCSFCTIPRARGKSRSLPLSTVVSQVQSAKTQGFNEVVLTGIHLAHYGWEFNTDLTVLLDAILNLPSPPRVRLSTLDPFEIPAGILNLMESNSSLCPFLHIALQSGDDTILKRMRRLYTTREFVEVTQEIHHRLPDAFIGVDVIVGFPGETWSAFNNTMETLRNTPWSKLHVFSFSQRKGTEAAKLDGKIEKSVIEARSKELRQLSDERFKLFLDTQIGKTREVLIETRSRVNPGLWRGHSENYVPVEIEIDNGMAKELRRVKLTSLSGSSVVAKAL